jgi:hypothetical protein
MEELLILVAWVFGQLERGLTLEEIHDLCEKVPDPKPDFVRVLMGVQNVYFTIKARDLALDDLKFELNKAVAERFENG